MKVITVALLAFLGIINALPQQKEISVNNETKDARFVGDIIASVLEDVSVQIREAGLDPWANDGTRMAYGLPVPVLFNADVHAEGLQCTGLSNIVINNIDYGLLSFRLTLDISLPEIAISVGDAGFDVTVLGSRFQGQGYGRLAIIEPRVHGTIQLSIGIISGISVREMNLEFELGSLEFNGNVNLLGEDYTPFITRLVNYQIPDRVRELRAEINELVEIIALEIVEVILN